MKQKKHFERHEQYRDFFHLLETFSNERKKKSKGGRRFRSKSKSRPFGGDDIYSVAFWSFFSSPFHSIHSSSDETRSWKRTTTKKKEENV